MSYNLKDLDRLHKAWDGTNNFAEFDCGRKSRIESRREKDVAFTDEEMEELIEQAKAIPFVSSKMVEDSEIVREYRAKKKRESDRKKRFWESVGFRATWGFILVSLIVAVASTIENIGGPSGFARTLSRESNALSESLFVSAKGNTEVLVHSISGDGALAKAEVRFRYPDKTPVMRTVQVTGCSAGYGGVTIEHTSGKLETLEYAPGGTRFVDRIADAVCRKLTT